MASSITNGGVLKLKKTGNDNEMTKMLLWFAIIDSFRQVHSLYNFKEFVNRAEKISLFVLWGLLLLKYNCYEQQYNC